MLNKLLPSFVLATALTFSLTSEAKSQTSEFIQVPCNQFQGRGTFSNPIVLGLVNRPVIIMDCPRLSSGKGFNLRYYQIALPASRSANAVAGAFANLAPGEISAVHPRLASLSGVTLLTSEGQGFWVGNPNINGLVGRFIPLTTIPEGSYLLGFAKIDSPLRSIQTPNFSIVIIP